MAALPGFLRLIAIGEPCHLCMMRRWRAAAMVIAALSTQRDGRYRASVRCIGVVARGHALSRRPPPRLTLRFGFSSWFRAFRPLDIAGQGLPGAPVP